MSFVAVLLSILLVGSFTSGVGVGPAGAAPGPAASPVHHATATRTTRSTVVATMTNAAGTTQQAKTTNSSTANTGSGTGKHAGSGKGAAPAAATAAGDEAVAYQIDATHDGNLTSTSVVPPLTQKWSRDLGGLMSYPIITGGRVFVTARSSGSTYGTTLYALDANTGADEWGPVPIPGTYYWSTLAAGGGQVYVINFDGVLRAFNLATGVLNWTVQLPNQYAFSSAPTYSNGIVYTGGAGSGGTVYATNASDGSLLWTAEVANGDDSSPAVTSTGVYVSYACEQTYDLDPATGQLIWHYNTSCEGGGGRTPVVADGKLWVRDWVNSPVVLNADTGALTGGFNDGPAPAFDGAIGFFLENGVLRARDASSQAELWFFSGDGGLISAPIVAGGFVYEASSSGQIWALDELTGEAVWSGNAGAAIYGPDEQNVSQPLTGLAAGGGLVVVPASNLLVAYQTSATQPAAITATAGATFAVGASNVLPIGTGGVPTPDLTEQGTLPGGVTFDGTGLVGKPAQRTAGSYPITLTASNGVGTDAALTFTLTVVQATMTEPADGQTNVDTTVPFTWSTIAPAQAYRLLIGTQLEGSDLVDSGILPSTQSSFDVPALPVGPVLHATLLAEVNNTWVTSQTITFTAAPGTALLTFPVDGQAAVDPTRAFTWTTVPGAQGYILVVGTSIFGTDVANSGVLPSSQSTFTPYLPGVTTLHATLLTKVNGVFSRYEAITFTTGAAMGQFTHPVNGQTNVATPMTVTWATVSGAQNYWLVIGTTFNGTNLVNSGLLPATQSSFKVAALPKGRTLYAALLTKVNGKWLARAIAFITG